MYDTSELQGLYEGKEVVVVGDSIGRQYYFSLLANMGSPAPEAHDDGAPKHQDLSWEGGREGARKVSFLWRPYAKDVVEEVRKWGQGGREGGPEVVVMSFGLWDTLHRTSEEEYAETLEALSQSLGGGDGGREEGKQFRAWLVPTGIVDEKLLTEEKRTFMTEDQVEGLRKRTMRSALFEGEKVVVLDGRRVSEGQEGRSEDGVHYDDVVYGALVQQAANALAVWKEGEGGREGGVSSKEGHRRLYVQSVRGLDDVADWEPWVSREEELQQQSSNHPQRMLKKEDGSSTQSSNSNRSTAAAAAAAASPAAAAAGGGKPAPLKPKEIDGSMSFPVHGAIVLIVCLLMLLTLDSYAGAAVLGLFLARSDASVTWEEAYRPLLSKILRASAPSSSSSSSISGGVGGGGLGGSIGGGANTSSSGGVVVHGVPHHHAGGSAVRGRYTPVPQAEMELGGIGDQPTSPSDSGPSAANEE
jgi:hypothetical protein